MLWIFGAGAAVEILLQIVPAVWRTRKVLAVLAVVANGFAAGALVLWQPNVFSALIAWASLFRAFNAIRIAEGRMHERYLHGTTRRTTAVLMGIQIAITGCWIVWNTWHTTDETSWALLAGAQLMVAVILLASTVRRLQRTAWPVRATHYSDTELPTLSVAIPARNETDDLQACLQSLIASDYPKLEIVVLDDCSQTRRTPEIIRGFAHDGVRFVQGEEPQEIWLPKNQAYDRLVEEVSGDYVLFCGVDVRFEPTTLRQVMNTMLARRKKMMSILPERAPGARSRAALAQAMRYVWELVPPRRLFRRPPVISSCWVIEKEALKALGGFDAARRSILPEAHFARRLAVIDGYSFMRAGRNPGLTSVKSAADQRDTAVRMRYPQLHRRPENVFALSLAEGLLILAPFGLAIGGAFFHAGMAAIILAAAACVLLTVTYVIVGLSTKISSWWFGIVAIAPVIAYDLVLLHYSMWQYEFSEVDWKGRNICVPAMHVIPHLPPLDK